MGLTITIPRIVNRFQQRLFGGESGNVFRGMLVLATGTGIARLIGVAAIPILTRIYSPEDFGVLAVFTAIVMILAPIVTLRYCLALPLPRHDATALNLLVLSAGLMLLLSALIALLLWGFGDTVLPLLSMEVLTPWWWLIAIGILAAASYELLTYWATRLRAYRIIARTNVWQSAAGSIVKIVLGLLSLQPAGLLIGQVVAKGGGIGVLLRGFWAAFRANLHQVTLSRIRIIAWRYRDLPVYRVPSQVLMVFAVQAPVLFIAFLYDAQITGQFSLAMMALTLPVSLLGRSTAKAFYAEASRLGPKRPQAIDSMLRDVLMKLAFVAIGPTVVLLFLGQILFEFVFGENWLVAGAFAQSLAIFLFFQFLQAPVAHVFYIFDGQRALLMLNLQRVILILALFGIAYWFDWEAAFLVWFYALGLAAHYALSTIYALRYIPRGTTE